MNLANKIDWYVIAAIALPSLFVIILVVLISLG